MRQERALFWHGVLIGCVLALFAVMAAFALGGCSGISPLDRAIIVAGCNDTIAQAAKAEADPNSNRDVLDLYRHFAFRAKYLKAWAEGAGFPAEAMDQVK